jgi:hypothetical protein
MEAVAVAVVISLAVTLEQHPADLVAAVAALKQSTQALVALAVTT